MPDLLALQKAIEKFNEESIPKLVAAIDKLVDHIDAKFDQNIQDVVDATHGVLDRINGARLEIPPRQ